MGRTTSLRNKSVRSAHRSAAQGKQEHLVLNRTSEPPGNPISIRVKGIKPKWFLFLVVAACACAGGMILFTTKWGAGVSTDSITYIDVARNFLKGYGLSNHPGDPMTHYPPLYPILLSISGLVGADPLDGGRYLQMLLFCATIAISGFMLYRATYESAIACIVGLLLLLTSNTLIYVYSFAWSEGLFIALCLAGFLLLGEYFQKSKWVLLLSSAILTGLALLTRYAGVSAVLTGCLCIVVLSRTSLIRRLLVTAIFGIIALCPVSLWLLRNSMVSSTLTNRSMAIHPIKFDQVKTGILTASNWLCLPQDWALSVRIGILVLCVALILTGYAIFLKHTKGHENRRILFVPSLFIIFSFSYLVVLGISISFVDAHTPLNMRILSPMYAIGVIGIVCLSYMVWSTCDKKQTAAMSILIISLLLLSCQSIQTASFANSLHLYGSRSSFLNKYWQQSQLIKLVTSLPDDIAIYTNAPDPIKLLARKDSMMLPAKLNPSSRINNKEYPSQFADMVKAVRSGTSIVVYFSGITWRWYLPANKEIAQTTHLPVLYQGRDGTIYGADKNILSIPSKITVR